MIKTFIMSLKHAYDGIKIAFKSERNLKIHSVIALIALLLAWLLNFSFMEYGILFLTIGVVISLELMNTAIEQVVDLACDKKLHPLAKKAKDISAGAVLFSAVIALIIGLCLYFPKIIHWL